MATHDWPAGLTPQTFAFGIQKAAVGFRSPFAGSIESVEFPGQYWLISLTLSERKLREGGHGAAFAARIAGGAERVRVPYWPRLVPRGTMRGSPVLDLAAARGDLALAIQTTTGNTLLAGDMIGVGGQVFQVFADCVSIGGVITVPLVNRVRGAIADASAVTWDRPTILCNVPATSSMRGYQPGVAGPLAIDLEEVPA